MPFPHQPWSFVWPVARLESVHAADDAVAVQGQTGGWVSQRVAATRQTLFTADRRAVRCRGVGARGEHHSFVPLGQVTETVFELRSANNWNPLLAFVLLALGLAQGLLDSPTPLFWTVGFPMAVLGALLLAFHLMSKSIVRLGVYTQAGHFHGIRVRANKDQIEQLRRASTHLDTLVETGPAT